MNPWPTRLPAISGRRAVRAFEKAGWRIARRKGSHIIMTKPRSIVSLSVPDHSPMKRGTLRSLISKAEIEVEEFLSLLE